MEPLEGVIVPNVGALAKETFGKIRNIANAIENKTLIIFAMVGISLFSVASEFFCEFDLKPVA